MYIFKDRKTLFSQKQLVLQGHLKTKCTIKKLHMLFAILSFFNHPFNAKCSISFNEHPSEYSVDNRINLVLIYQI